MQIIHTVCTAISAVFGLLFAYRLLFIVIGLFKTKVFAPAKAQHRYAVLVSARNEEAVIGNLLESIARQDYPQDKITVFVVADNCSDQTAKVAAAHGAQCYERFDPEHQTKGYALQFLFQQIERDFGIDRFEGYFLFDADNLLKKDYISRMNDAFDSGEKIVTSYRNTKNFDTNFISAGYALHWLRSARFEYRGRSFLGLSAWVQGCGFLFSSEVVRDGWNYVTLTEDRSFSIDAIAKGIRITYQHEAQFYDEQPIDLKIAMRQRIRWAKGFIEAFRDYALPLVRGIFCGKRAWQRISSYDLLVMTIPYCLFMIPVKVINLVAVSALCLAGSTLSQEWLTLLWKPFEILVFEHFGVIPMAIAIFILDRKRMPKIKWHHAAFYTLMYPLFSIIGYIATWIAAFTHVTWKPIPHGASVRIEELEMKMNADTEKESPEKIEK